MEELKSKIGQALRGIIDLSNVLEKTSKFIDDLGKKKKELEFDIVKAKESYNKVITESSKIKEEFEKFRKAETAKIESLKNELEAKIKEVLGKESIASKLLESAKQKEEIFISKINDANRLKEIYEEKVNKVKSAIQNLG